MHKNELLSASLIICLYFHSAKLIEWAFGPAQSQQCCVVACLRPARNQYRSKQQRKTLTLLSALCDHKFSWQSALSVPGGRRNSLKAVQSWFELRAVLVLHCITNVG